MINPKNKKFFIIAGLLLLVTNILAVFFVFYYQRIVQKSSNKETFLKLELANIKEKIISLDTSLLDSSQKLYWTDAISEIPFIDSSLIKDKLGEDQLANIEKNLEDLKILSSKLEQK